MYLAAGTTPSSASISAKQVSRRPLLAGQRASTSPWAVTTPASSATGRGSRPFSRPPTSAVVHTMNSTSRGSGRTRPREPASVAVLAAVTSPGPG
jgi:hypothetical protein